MVEDTTRQLKAVIHYSEGGKAVGWVAVKPGFETQQTQQLEYMGFDTCVTFQEMEDMSEAESQA